MKDYSQTLVNVFLALVVFLCALVMTGCGPFASNLQKEQGLSQETSEVVKAWGKTELISEAPELNLKTVTPEGAITEVTIPGAIRGKQEKQLDSGTATEEKASFFKKVTNNWKYILVGAGLLLIIYAAREALRLAKDSGLSAGVERAIGVIESWRGPETDEKIISTLSSIKAEVRDAKSKP